MHLKQINYRGKKLDLFFDINTDTCYCMLGTKPISVDSDISETISQAKKRIDEILNNVPKHLYQLTMAYPNLNSYWGSVIVVASNRYEAVRIHPEEDWNKNKYWSSTYQRVNAKYLGPTNLKENQVLCKEFVK